MREVKNVHTRYVLRFTGGAYSTPKRSNWIFLLGRKSGEEKEENGKKLSVQLRSGLLLGAERNGRP